jgi:hypothetical protein
MPTSGVNNVVTIVNTFCGLDTLRNGQWGPCPWEGDAEIHADLGYLSGMWKCPDCGGFNEATFDEPSC